jgi:hypothetical protein
LTATLRNAGHHAGAGWEGVLADPVAYLAALGEAGPWPSEVDLRRLQQEVVAQYKGRKNQDRILQAAAVLDSHRQTPQQVVAPVILSLDGGAYTLEGLLSPPIKVGDGADAVLQAFLGAKPIPPAEVLTTAELVKRSGQDYPGKILRTLKEGPLGAAIHCPGQHAKGQGYAVRIRRQPPT